MKINFISIHIKNSPLSMPLAAGILKAELYSHPEIKKQASVIISDFYKDDDEVKITNDILTRKGADLAGFSVYLWNTEKVMRICHKLKMANPYIALMVGGAEPSSNPALFENNPDIDFIISGEGEKPVKDIVLSLINNKKPDERVIFSEDVKNLDEYLSPFLTGVIDPVRYDGVIWELSRGCPFRCDYCFESRGTGVVRNFAMERIKKELELFEEKKVIQVFVLDPAFNVDRERAKLILGMIHEIAPEIHFTFEIREEFIDAELASSFSKIHCSIQIGLQSSDPVVCSNIGRNFDPVKYSAGIRMLNKKGIIYGLDLIYGLPGDTLSGYKKSLDYALDLEPNNIDIFPLSIIAGTALFEKASTFGIKYDTRPPYGIISSPLFDAHDLNIASDLKDTCDFFYNKGGAVGWFKAVLRELNMKGSEFLILFSNFYKTKQNNVHTRNEITDIQISFVRSIFSKAKKEFLFPPIRSLIQYLGAMDTSLYAGSVKLEKDYGRIKLCPGTILILLDYDPDDLTHIGNMSLKVFVKKYKPKVSNTVIYNLDGFVSTITVDGRWYKLLSAVGQYGCTLKALYVKFSEIEKKEIKGFVDFIVEEKIAQYTS